MTSEQFQFLSREVRVRCLDCGAECSCYDFWYNPNWILHGSAENHVVMLCPHTNVDTFRISISGERL